MLEAYLRLARWTAFAPTPGCRPGWRASSSTKPWGAAPRGVPVIPLDAAMASLGPDMQRWLSDGVDRQPDRIASASRSAG